MLPQVGVSGGMPMPRNGQDGLDQDRRKPQMNVPCTISGATVLRQHVAHGSSVGVGVPTVMAAST